MSRLNLARYRTITITEEDARIQLARAKRFYEEAVKRLNERIGLEEKWKA